MDLFLLFLSGHHLHHPTLLQSCPVSTLSDRPCKIPGVSQPAFALPNQWTWVHIQASTSRSRRECANDLMWRRPSPIPSPLPLPPSRSLNPFRSTSPRLWPVRKSCCVFNLVGLSFPRTFLQQQHHIYIFLIPPSAHLLLLLHICTFNQFSSALSRR